MSRDNYKRLGDYIRPVNIRNKDLHITKLLGVSIQKILMPSIANTVGTNMKTYKIIKKNQFAYGPVTSRNGDKISIALLQDFDEAIISQAYTVFEVIDTNEVNPEYLMMWFRRPEFDRYARYKSHGSARETFDWDEICEVELPIPSIEKQNAIVKEYNTVVNRIKLSEQLNQKLEETSQAIYKHWFVDFEFPNEDGKAYKSSGGKMVWNDVLEKDIPEGWRDGVLDDEFDITIGRTPPRNENQWFCLSKGMKWISIKDIGNSGSYIIETNEQLTNEAIGKFKIPIIPKNTTILSFKMTVGKVSITNEDMLSNEAIAHFKIKNSNELTTEYIYCFLKNYKFNKLGTTSSIVNSINSKMIKEISFLIPNNTTLLLFNRRIIKVLKQKKINEIQIITLKKMSNILLSKMSKI